MTRQATPVSVSWTQSDNTVFETLINKEISKQSYNQGRKMKILGKKYEI